MLRLGTDLKNSDPVLLDASRSRVILVCGKRGSGKSYSLGVITEELFAMRPRPLVILVDPMGIFWKTAFAEAGACPAENFGGAWENPFPNGIPVKVLTPGSPQVLYSPEVLSHMASSGISFEPIKLDPSELSPDQWCGLFDLSLNEPLGITLYRAIQNLRQEGPFVIPDILKAIQEDPWPKDQTKLALTNRLKQAEAWGIFEEEGPGARGLGSGAITNARSGVSLRGCKAPEAISLLDKLNILDLSTIDPGAQGLRSLIVCLLAQKLFKDKVRARREEELKDAASSQRIWLLIDEAHQFIPQDRTALSKDVLIRWVKEGRQPGLSCVLATQQPSSLDSEVISQADAILAHKTTNAEDINSINRLSQSYMGAELKAYVRNLHDPGEAVLVDDLKERLFMLKVRPRFTQHGGGERIAE